MPAHLAKPSDLVIHKIASVVAVEITAFHVDTPPAPQEPVLIIATEATVFVAPATPEDPGDPEADPPVPPTPGTPAVYRRVAMPNFECRGQDLAEVMADATKRTIAARNIQVGIKGAFYARLAAAGRIPEGAEIV